MTQEVLNKMLTKIVKLLQDHMKKVPIVKQKALNKKLIMFSICGHKQLVELALEKGADVHAEDDRALRYASYEGHVEVIKLLLDAGADVHADNNYALRWASEFGHTEIVELLIDAGADVRAVDDEALRRASRSGHTEVVKVLKEHMKKEGL